MLLWVSTFPVVLIHLRKRSASKSERLKCGHLSTTKKNGLD